MTKEERSAIADALFNFTDLLQNSLAMEYYALAGKPADIEQMIAHLEALCVARDEMCKCLCRINGPLRKALEEKVGKKGV
jgi:hypothetical protein